jgi:hypothetical protein
MLACQTTAGASKLCPHVYDLTVVDVVVYDRFNGGIPGPVITVTPCNTYEIILRNLQSGWPNVGGPLNSFRDPATVNLHTHGLHVSGAMDNVHLEILPGNEARLKYAVPCDHAGERKTPLKLLKHSQSDPCIVTHKLSSDSIFIHRHRATARQCMTACRAR